MANDPSHTHEPSMASLVSGIIRDTQTLIKQEVALAKHEFKDEIVKSVQAVASLAVGIGLLALGVIFICVMVVLLLAWAVTAIPLWGWFGIVGAILAIAGGSLLYLAKTKAEDIHLVPPQTAATLKENAQWIKNQT